MIQINEQEFLKESTLLLSQNNFEVQYINGKVNDIKQKWENKQEKQPYVFTWENIQQDKLLIKIDYDAKYCVEIIYQNLNKGVIVQIEQQLNIRSEQSDKPQNQNTIIQFIDQKKQDYQQPQHINEVIKTDLVKTTEIIKTEVVKTKEVVIQQEVFKKQEVQVIKGEDATPVLSVKERIRLQETQKKKEEEQKKLEQQNKIHRKQKNIQMQKPPTQVKNSQIDDRNLVQNIQKKQQILNEDLVQKTKDAVMDTEQQKNTLMNEENDQISTEKQKHQLPDEKQKKQLQLNEFWNKVRQAQSYDKTNNQGAINSKDEDINLTVFWLQVGQYFPKIITELKNIEKIVMNTFDQPLDESAIIFNENFQLMNDQYQSEISQVCRRVAVFNRPEYQILNSPSHLKNDGNIKCIEQKKN